MKGWAWFLFLSGSSAALALPLSHSPFFPEENYTLSLDACMTSRDVSNPYPPEAVVEYWLEDSARYQIRIIDNHYQIRVREDGEWLGDALDVEIEAVMPFDLAEEAICHDLNGDAKTDFVVNLWHHGNGLGAQYYTRLIGLSDSGGYRFWLVPTMTPSREDFVTFGELAPTVMVTTQFANTGKLEGRPRSYFIYDLWIFLGGEIVSANSVDDRFPKWVWWTFEENHKPSISLSEEIRERLKPAGVMPFEVIAGSD